MFDKFVKLQTEPNIYSAIINNYRITLRKFDAIILVDDNDSRSRSFAVQIAMKSMCIVSAIACLFAFN